MNDVLPVVLVKGEDGNPLRINESHYLANQDKYTLHEDDESDLERAPVGGTLPPGVTLMVKKIGRKFFAVNPDETKVTGITGIDENGYDTDQAAWAAVIALAPAA